jgi:hypothetical protein
MAGRVLVLVRVVDGTADALRAPEGSMDAVVAIATAGFQITSLQRFRSPRAGYPNQPHPTSSGSPTVHPASRQRTACPQPSVSRNLR